jgi:hypothetical protein
MGVTSLRYLKGQKWFKTQELSKIWAADRGGVVHFWLCDDQSEEERRALRVAAESITGVRRVEEHIVPASYLTASPDRQ